MPQRRPDFDEGFLDDDTDLKIAHPSPNAEIYTRSGRSSPSLLTVIVFLLMMSAGFGGVFFYGFQRGVEEGQRSLPPVVLADKSPIKKMPNEVPGGVSGTPENLNIYNVARGGGTRTKAKSKSPPESGPPDNADGTIESLIRSIENAVLGKKPDSSAETNSVKRLKKHGIEVSPPRPDLNRAPSATAKSAPQATPKPKFKPARKAKKTVAKVGPALAQSSARGIHMVQLAASRSRTLARGVYTNLQSKHGDQLGRRDPLILRVDLGRKGIFYRVNVAGFSSRAAAKRFCDDLKGRGQDCLVRKQP